MPILKPLRYAENVHGLKSHIDKYVKVDFGTEAVLSYAEKLYDKFKENELLGEQESEYIFGMAFVENIAGIRKRPEIKKNPEFAHHPVFRKLGPALDRLEKLKIDLTQRYATAELTDLLRERADLELQAAQLKIKEEAEKEKSRDKETIAQMKSEIEKLQRKVEQLTTCPICDETVTPF